jgi:hypothetical protein
MDRAALSGGCGSFEMPLGGRDEPPSSTVPGNHASPLVLAMDPGSKWDQPTFASSVLIDAVDWTMPTSASKDH